MNRPEDDGWERIFFETENPSKKAENLITDVLGDERTEEVKKAAKFVAPLAYDYYKAYYLTKLVLSGFGVAFFIGLLVWTLFRNVLS